MIFLFLIIPVRCIISYNKKTSITVKVFGITIYSSKKRKSSSKDRTDESKDKIPFLKENTGELKKLLKSVYSLSKKEITIEELNLYYKFGLGDAAMTGIYSGGVYTLLHGFGAFVYNNFKVKKQQIDILPDFDNNINDFKTRIVFKLKIINIIKFAAKLALNLIK